MVLILEEVEKKTQSENELADTHTLSSRLIEDRCYLDLFFSPSLSLPLLVVECVEYYCSLQLEFGGALLWFGVLLYRLCIIVVLTCSFNVDTK
ncbi:hypothetical protein GIB67_031882 [Kingdonia uniflora]|uniref:Uncharacterized protein n=1 Tax=Kingdonia uniflora TaxID=39325 RepID=A0A7J7LGP8_9MAGN|nr:hypothetical protein GIB67_031882 [Kingdonia uniflora]